jgi:hypothetical protein
MKSLVIAMVVFGATSLPAFAQQSNTTSDEMTPTIKNTQMMPSADAGVSDQSYGMSRSGTMQSGNRDIQERFQLTPEQRDIYKGS